MNSQRKKIKKLISELNKMEKEIDKNNVDKIMKEQNAIIKNHMEQRKREFNDYFLKIKEKKNFYIRSYILAKFIWINKAFKRII